MKARLLRNKKGQVVASVLHTAEDPALVPLDAELEDEGEVMEVELRPRDLFDLDRLHSRFAKGAKEK